jgi:capsular polysaccharide transport system permease protein
MEALRIQGRVLLALMLREARTRYGRRQAGYLWALFEPLTHMAMFIVMFSFLGRAVPLGDSLAAFLVTGLGPYLGFRNVMTRTQGAYASNEALLSFPVVKVMDTFIGRALLELATGLTVTFILFTVLIATGYSDMPSNVLMMLSAVFLLFLIGFGAGLVIGVIGQFLPSFATLFSLPSRLLYWMSCIFYIPESMPPSARDIIAWNPIAHGVTMFRMGYYKLYDSHMLDINYLCGWATSAVLVAFIVERVARKPLRNLV